MIGTTLTLPRIKTGLTFAATEDAAGADAALMPAELSFRRFIEIVRPSYKFYDYLEPLIARLQEVADGKLSRLMIWMPPRYFKSETVSRLFAAYYLYRYPQRFVGLASYGAALAYGLSSAARENYRAVAELSDDTKAKSEWQTPARGGLWAAGVGGPITGRGCHLGIIDDPIKNERDAASETFRLHQRDWYQNTFYTRLEPGAAIIIIQTRWHEDDLCGWLLAREHGASEEAAQEAQDEAQPEHWHVLSMPAIKELQGPVIPATCTLERDARAVGAPLCKERYPLSRLMAIRRNVGDYAWNSLYQQRPSPPGGSLIERAGLQIAPASNPIAWRVRYWDKAASERAGAKYSAGVLLAITQSGAIYVEDVIRGQWATAPRREIMLQTAQLDAQRTNNSVVIFIEQEPGSSGLDSVNDEIRLLAQFPVYADRPSGDKDTRIRPFAAQVAASNVWLVGAPWNLAFIEELVALPNGRYRDQADAVAGAYNRLQEMIHEAQRPNMVVYEEIVEISPL